jgi:cell division protein FtsL
MKEKKVTVERKNKLKFTDKLLSVISSFTIIFLLCYLALVTIDLNNVWKAINDSASIIKKQDKKIRDLQILFIIAKKKGTSL